MKESLIIREAAPDRWEDLEHLFGTHGACGGCWCMWWRMSQGEFNRQKGEGNRKALRKIIAEGEIPGLLAYRDESPIGWVCVGPRERFARLANSKVLAPVDDQPVWSVVCFYIARGRRRTGIGLDLLKAAAKFARDRGAKILEGYPSAPKAGKQPDAFVWTGLESMFRKSGFRVAVRRGDAGRGIWRLKLVGKESLK
jgi:GNAT superfamily N-acetyltransferase